MLRKTLFLSCATLSLGLFGCGGATGSGKTAEEPAGSGSGFGTSADDGGNEQPQGPDCSDGTCFLCGEGICPKGAYCDQNASGGAACAWLPECAGEPTCACVTGVLGASCTCSESGGPTVSCN